MWKRLEQKLFPVSKLPNAFEEWLWDLDDEDNPAPMSRDEVQDCIRRGEFLMEMFVPEHGGWEWTREMHVARVAHFCVHGWDTPIWVDLYEDGDIGLDGHHRATAAFYLGKTEVEAFINVFIG